MALLSWLDRCQGHQQVVSHPAIAQEQQRHQRPMCPDPLRMLGQPGPHAHASFAVTTHPQLLMPLPYPGLVLCREALLSRQTC